jgi:hypothetical protein
MEGSVSTTSKAAHSDSTPKLWRLISDDKPGSGEKCVKVFESAAGLPARQDPKTLG